MHHILKRLLILLQLPLLYTDTTTFSSHLTSPVFTSYFSLGLAVKGNVTGLSIIMGCCVAENVFSSLASTQYTYLAYT